MLALVAIAAAVVVAVSSAAPARAPEPEAPTPEADGPEPEAAGTGTEEAAPSPVDDPPAAAEPARPSPFSGILVAGPPRIVEDLSYQQVMEVADEPLAPPSVPSLKLVAGITAAGIVLGGVLAAVAKAIYTLFPNWFKLFK